jgi:hypothetical protein
MQFIFLKWNFNQFSIFLLHYNFTKNFHTKKEEAWGHEMVCMLFIYAFNMCKMKDHNMNKKGNITQISNIITHDNMIT